MILDDELLQELKKRTTKGSKHFYEPFDLEDSIKLREYYKSQLNIPIITTSLNLYTPRMTLLAKEYNRIVIGDYGAYIECLPNQIQLINIKNKFSSELKRPVKYIWMVPKDGTNIKIYFQQGTVSYADYVVGRYYLDPNEVLIED